jgi:hypothetical protein
MDDTTIVLCVAAAFTKDRSGIVSESKICDVHTSAGKLYQGYPEKAVNGSVMIGAHGYEFAEGTQMDMAKAAQEYGGSFFQQNLVIFEDKRHPVCVATAQTPKVKIFVRFSNIFLLVYKTFVP